MIDLSENSHDAEDAHLEALAFSFKKKIKYNGPKCKGMVVNKKKNERLGIMLEEEEEEEEEEESISFLAKINKKGSDQA